jgi:hypothetical protein
MIIGILSAWFFVIFPIPEITWKIWRCSNEKEKINIGIGISACAVMPHDPSNIQREGN